MWVPGREATHPPGLTFAAIRSVRISLGQREGGSGGDSLRRAAGNGGKVTGGRSAPGTRRSSLALNSGAEHLTAPLPRPASWLLLAAAEIVTSAWVAPESQAPRSSCTACQSAGAGAGAAWVWRVEGEGTPGVRDPSGRPKAWGGQLLGHTQNLPATCLFQGTSCAGVSDAERLLRATPTVGVL